jgi:hypothetical protein
MKNHSFSLAYNKPALLQTMEKVKFSTAFLKDA